MQNYASCKVPPYTPHTYTKLLTASGKIEGPTTANLVDVVHPALDDAVAVGVAFEEGRDLVVEDAPAHLHFGATNRVFAEERDGV